MDKVVAWLTFVVATLAFLAAALVIPEVRVRLHLDHPVDNGDCVQWASDNVHCAKCKFELHPFEIAASDVSPDKPLVCKNMEPKKPATASITARMILNVGTQPGKQAGVNLKAGTRFGRGGNLADAKLDAGEIFGHIEDIAVADNGDATVSWLLTNCIYDGPATPGGQVLPGRPGQCSGSVVVVISQ